MKFTKLLKKNKEIQGLAALSILTLSGCGPQSPDFSILGASQGTFQGSVANNKVDLLFVIDNSGSMLTKQENLKNGFGSFANVFVNKGFDFNIAIVTTDIRSNPTGQEGMFQGLPKVITNTPGFVTAFGNNVVVGAAGDPNAKALDAINLSLSPGLLGGANTGFVRPDAHLAVIALSDADDNDSAASPANVVSFLNGLKPDKFDVLSRTYKKNFTVSGVVVQAMNDPDCYDMDKDGFVDNDGDADGVPDVFLYEEGIKFKALAAATNGSIASICKADFSPGLTQISQRIAEAITEIPLGTVPNPATIVVTFNGTPVPGDATDGWTYSSTGNKIVFHGNSIPQDNTSIGINYIPNDIIR